MARGTVPTPRVRFPRWLALLDLAPKERTARVIAAKLYNERCRKAPKYDGVQFRAIIVRLEEIARSESRVQLAFERVRAEAE